MVSSSYIAANVLCVVLFLADQGDAFLPPPPPRTQEGFSRVASAYSWGSRRSSVARRCTYSSPLYMRSWYDEEEDDDDDDDEEMIDPDSLGDWRAFRRNLAVGGSSTDPEKTEKAPSRQSVSRQNEELLKSQNEELAKEYTSNVWAHETSTPEVGGMVVRLPLEAEIYRNYRHSVTGQKLRKKHQSIGSAQPEIWYRLAQSLVETEMLGIAEKAGNDGQIDATSLNDDSQELLQLYLDNQETWQETCLVLERDEVKGTATTLVLNRPMAFKLTENLGRLALYGVYQSAIDKNKMRQRKKADLIKFMLAFGQECAVYIGGPDGQDQPAELIHGIADLPGAAEISPGSRIYRGGLEAATDGVLAGKYKPLDFRFFVGHYSYEESMLDVSVVLGKYQPIACARSLVLKQCISLPKPLWHEVLELCGGELEEISKLEMAKRDDLKFQVIDEDDEDGLDDLPDELDELDRFDDDDEDYYTN